mgnify:CR=1 FL=1
MALNPIDVIAGLVVIGAGVLTIFGYVNLAVIVGGIGFLIEAIKVALSQGLR